MEDGTISNKAEDVKQGFLNFFQELYAAKQSTIKPHLGDIKHLVTNRLSLQQKGMLSNPVTEHEIREAVFSLGRNKALGLDGYTTEFFTNCWNTVGPHLIEAITDFFKRGKLLKEVSNTLISLIPKVQNPSSPSDYQPISCCNVIYKCITKIIANRVLSILPSIIGT